nr:CatB-related O-acetyltransferase [Psychrobacter glacincola]
MKKPIFTNCKFAKTARLHTEGHVSVGNTEFYNSIFIGFSTYMGSGIIRGNILIGRYCSIGKDVKLGLSEHRLDNFTTHPLFQDKTLSKVDIISNKTLECTIPNYPNAQIHLIIGDDVWIGDNVLVKKGVKIGQGAVIGANSLVTKDIPPYAIVVGSPAKILRYRFSEEIIDKLLVSEWWDIEPSQIRDLSPSDSLEEFIEKAAALPRNFEKNYIRYIHTL